MKLKHPDGGPTVETTRDKADVYLSQGWAEVKAPAKTADPKPDPKGK